MQALLADCPLTVCIKASVTSALGRTEIKIRGEAPCQSLSAEERAGTCGQGSKRAKNPSRDGAWGVQRGSLLCLHANLS